MESRTTKAGEITRLLRQVSAGDTAARNRLFDLMYRDLRKLAAYSLRGERRHDSLQPTALVHEAYLRVFEDGPVTMNDGHHFLAMAAQAMRRILVDRARARTALRRDFRVTVKLTDQIVYSDQNPEEMLALDAALDRLAQFAPRQSQVVEMRYFGGMQENEIAAQLQVSERTVKRDWALAKVWLYGELKGEHAGKGPAPN